MVIIYILQNFLEQYLQQPVLSVLCICQMVTIQTLLLSLEIRERFVEYSSRVKHLRKLTQDFPY